MDKSVSNYMRMLNWQTIVQTELTKTRGYPEINRKQQIDRAGLLHYTRMPDIFS